MSATVRHGRRKGSSGYANTVDDPDRVHTFVRHCYEANNGTFSYVVPSGLLFLIR